MTQSYFKISADFNLKKKMLTNMSAKKLLMQIVLDGWVLKNAFSR